MKTEYFRNEGETDDELIYRICSLKESIGTWNDVADIINTLLNKSCDESVYRKKYSAFQSFVGISNPSAELIELRNERKKIQTEKIELEKWIRERSRDELIEEKIVEAISNLSPLNIPEPIQVENIDNTKEFILAFADCHYGVEFDDMYDLNGNKINSYSPEVFEYRMRLLLAKVIDIVEKENIQVLNIWELGDGINGILRLNSQLMKLKYGIIDSTIRYAEYISNWLNILSKFVKIKYQMVIDSNHCQIRICGAPKNAFPDENMSKIMLSIIKERLKNNPNIEIIENYTGNNFITLVNGKNVIGIHGEVNNLDVAMNEYSRLYNTSIDYIISAHKHHYYSEDIGKDIEVYSIRSIIGTDPYSLSLRKSTKAGASLFCFEKFDGLCCEYKISL